MKRPAAINQRPGDCLLMSQKCCSPKEAFQGCLKNDQSGTGLEKKAISLLSVTSTSMQFGQQDCMLSAAKSEK